MHPANGAHRKKWGKGKSAKEKRIGREARRPGVDVEAQRQNGVTIIGIGRAIKPVNNAAQTHQPPD
jgi:hypothetical protein